jgi:ABC-type spermidine/putrescine transport system permease subunit II
MAEVRADKACITLLLAKAVGEFYGGCAARELGTAASSCGLWQWTTMIHVTLPVPRE